MSSQIDQLINYINNLPLNTIIYWGDNSASLEKPYCGEWIDVIVPEIQEFLGWNWIWTIESPFSFNCLKEEFVNSGGNPETFMEEHACASETIFIESNVVIHGIWDTELHWWKDEIILPYGEVPSSDYMYNPNYDFRPGWTVEYISETLSKWCLNFCNRSDIKFEWSSLIEDPLFVQLEEDYENINIYKESYTLYEDPKTGWKISATNQVMDVLLSQDGDTSASVMETMKDILNDHLLSE